MAEPTTVNRVSIRPADQLQEADFHAVLFKMLGFTSLMVVLPLGTYWYTLSHYFHTWKDGTTYAGIAAAVAANLVLALFVITAIYTEDPQKAEKDLKKKQ